MSKLNRIYIFLILSMVLASCSGVRNLKQPELDMPATYNNDMPVDSASIADMKWWEFYADPTLSSLIRKALVNNRNFLKAQATVERMRELYGVDKLNLVPEISAQAYGQQETNNYGGGGVKKDPEYGLKATVAWEVNLMGAQTWKQRDAKAQYLASVYDMRAMQMLIIANTASAYFNLVALNNELHIVQQTMKTRSESLKQAKLRFEGGLTSETVYQQAMVEYSSAASLVPDLERRIVMARNALSLLMGEYPSDSLQFGLMDVYTDMPSELPLGIPSQLVERRPDILAAQERLSSAMAQVGLSYANRFPNFRISLTGGLENDEMPQFFKSPFTYIAGALAGPVLDFGKRKRAYKASIAAYDAARYDYEQAVLQAFHEVENSRESYRRTHESAQLKVNLRDAAAKYVQLAHLQYRGGTLSYLDVLDAQRRYFEAQISVSNAIRDEYLSLVALYKALGGALGE